jgi:hypothetical protein
MVRKVLKSALEGLAGFDPKRTAAVGALPKGAKQLRKSAAKTTDVEGVVEFDRLYHGSPQTDLTEVSTTSSKSIGRTKGAHDPSVHLSDDPVLSKSFTRGELGDKPEGRVYEAIGPFKVIDIETEQGRKIWNELGQDETAALAAGYDGIRHPNYEELKIRYFYKHLNPDDVEDASEIRIFKTVKLR